MNWVVGAPEGWPGGNVASCGGAKLPPGALYRGIIGPAPVLPGTKGDGAAVSSLVIAKPLGTFPEPLAFLFLLLGPNVSEGDACLDKLRGVIATGTDCCGWATLTFVGGNWSGKLWC